MTLDEAWAEFRETADEHGVHVGTLEAMQFLSEAASGASQRRHQPTRTPEQEERARFFDWLLHVKQDKGLAYALLRQVGTLTVGPRQYWATDQAGRRAIAWESIYTYPDSDSEIWDVIFVDEAK
jgi:hypothetical protein